MRRRAFPLAVVALAVAPQAWADAERAPHEPAELDHGEELSSFVPGASRLEGRILAPCCWNQTIDIHGSEVAYELRREIRDRLRKGESADAIEASFVKRYGSKILAVPEESPLRGVALLLATLFAGGGVGAVLLLRRWQRRTADKPRPGAPAPSRDAKSSQEAKSANDALDERLDRELRELDE